uniref:SpoIVB peptidase n=1 Tax=Agathobacter sp. TaxID=2021311 RepID=UPI00405654E9
MRNFYLRTIKNLIAVYVCAFILLSYELILSEIPEQDFFGSGRTAGNEQIKHVYASGKIVGIYTKAEGIFVIATSLIESAEGTSVNPARSAVKSGDYIMEMNGAELTCKEDMINIVAESEGNPIQLTVMRDEVTFETEITPVLARNGAYMLGIWVKDDLAGVGTVTYFTEDGSFAALGHGMSDGETEYLMKTEEGDIYRSNIISIRKGEKGTPGEIKSVIYYGNSNHLGKLNINSATGVFGTLDGEDLEIYAASEDLYPVAQKQEIAEGPAKIISEVSGERKMYDIEITYVDYLSIDSKKGLHIEVTDKELLELTGGIVQGMSGSPIIQNGKIVGAVTHVLVNSPTKGYGIFIENMLDAER